MEQAKDKLSAQAGPDHFTLLRNKRTYNDEISNITVRTSGVYKIGANLKERMSTSAADKTDFIPLDFMEKRKKK